MTNYFLPQNVSAETKCGILFMNAKPKHLSYLQLRAKVTGTSPAMALLGAVNYETPPWPQKLI